MARYANLFQDWEVNMVRAAEMSGTLPEAIDEIATTLEGETRLRSRVFSVTLPMIFTVAVAVLVLLVVQSLSNFSGDVPTVLRRLLNVLLIFLCIIVLVLVAWQLGRIAARTRSGSFFFNAVITHVPLLGPIMRSSMRIRFARVLAAMWNAGVGPMDSVLSAARASGNLAAIYRARYEVPRLGEGAQLADVVEAVHIFPRDAMHIIRTGEASGSLPESLRKVGEYYKVDLDAQVETLPTKVIAWYYLLIVPFILYFIIHFYSNYFRQAMDMMQ